MAQALTFDDYLAIAKRRAWKVIIVFITVLIISVLVINRLPPRYRSTATVSVESQQIPEELVQSTVSGYANERIGFVEQRVMTSARLLEIIEKFQLFPEERDDTPNSVLINKFREDIFLEMITDPAIRRGRASMVVAFTLGVEHRDPEIAAAVANELVTIFLEENVRTRTARATETTEFLAQEAAGLARQVSAMEKRVAGYKQEHGDKLPEHLEMHMDMLQRSETELNSLARDITSLEEERRFLETQRATFGALLSAGEATDAEALSPAQILATLKFELVDKTAIYAPAHPDLRNLRRRIAQMEREVESVAPDRAGQPSGAPVDPGRVQIESQIVSVEARLASLREQKRELHDGMKELQHRITETPQVERELKDLSRDYENALAEYEEIRSKQRDAELSESLEEQEKAERFVLLESPQVPSVPVWPDKKKAYTMGFVLAAGSGAGTAFLAEILDKSIRGPAMLTSILQRHPLAVIPFIESSADRRRERARRLWLLLVAFIVCIAVLVVVHLFYQRLDALANSLLQAVGLP